MSKTNVHWTGKSNNDFRYNIAFDFIYEIEDRLKLMGWNQDKLAIAIGVSKGRISQLLNNPGNLTLDTMVNMVRSLGIKLSIVPYDDNDAINANGPISSRIFISCWNELKKPRDVWEFEENIGHRFINAYEHNIVTSKWNNVSLEPCQVISLSERKASRLMLSQNWKEQSEQKKQETDCLTG